MSDHPNPIALAVAGKLESMPIEDLAVKKDVMQIIESLEDDGKKSKYLQGHIDKNIMDDTFLVNAEQKVPDSSLAINCTDHNRPAVFFSQK